MPGPQLYTGCVCSWECYVGEHDDPEHTCDPDPDTTCDRDVRSSLLQWRPRRHKHAMCVAPSLVNVHRQAPCVNLLAASSCTGQGRTHVCDGACRCSGESAVEEEAAPRFLLLERDAPGGMHNKVPLPPHTHTFSARPAALQQAGLRLGF